MSGARTNLRETGQREHVLRPVAAFQSGWIEFLPSFGEYGGC